MDGIEKIIRENCWKFDKGYPDSQEDINYLKTLIEQQLSFFSDEEIDDITVTIKDKVGVDLDKVSSDVRNDILDIVGDDAKLSNDDLDNVKNYISGIKYKKGIIDYISSKGAGEKQVSTKIFNKMLETGEAETYFNYIKNPYKYSFLGDGGALSLSFFFSIFFIKFYKINLVSNSEDIIVLMLVPGFDMFRLFVLRILNKKNPFSADENHIHHILFRIFKNNGIVQLIILSMSICSILILHKLAICVFEKPSFLASIRISISRLIPTFTKFFSNSIISLISLRKKLSM